MAYMTNKGKMAFIVLFSHLNCSVFAVNLLGKMSFTVRKLTTAARF